GEAIERRKQQLQPAALAVLLVRGAAGGADVLYEAVLLVEEGRNAIGQNAVNGRIGERAVRRALITLTDREVRRAPRSERLRMGYKPQRTNGRVLAEQRAVRAAQYLDAIQVGKVLVGHAGVGEEDPVNQHANGGLEGVVPGGLTQTAQGDARAPGVGS